MKMQSKNSKSPKRVAAPKRTGGLEAASEAALGFIGEDLESFNPEADRAIGLLAAIVDSSDDAIISKNLDGIVTSWNKGAERIFGYSAQEAIGQHITLIIPVDGHGEEAEILERIKRGHRIDHFEALRKHKDGTLLNIWLTISPVRDKRGRIIGASKVARDITARKRSELETQELHRKIEQQARIFDTTLSSITDFVYIFDREGRFIYVNQALLDLWGLRLEEASGKNFFDLKYPDALAMRLQNQIQQVIDTKEKIKDETPYKSPTGADGYYEYIFSPVFDDNRNVEVVAGSTRDITERKRTEEALRDAKGRLEATLTANEIATWTFEPQTNQVFADDKLARMFSVTSQEAHGGPIESYFRAIHPDDRDRVQATISELLNGTKSQYEVDYRLLHSDGSIRWVAARGKVQRDSSGRPIRFPGVVIDITGRKNAEKMLRESEERYRALAVDLDRQVSERTSELEVRNSEIVQQTERLRELSSRLLQIQDNERRHLARELHDSAGQLVTALAMNLGGVASLAKDNPWLKNAITDSQNLVQELSKEIRTVSYLLHPPLLDESGLESAINWYIQGLAERSGMRIDLVVSPNFDRLPREMELAVFRIVQESLTNVHRHSGSKTATINLSRESEGVLLVVQDHGEGIPQEKLSSLKQSKGAGVGIAGMRERLQRFAGSLDIESDDRGTRVSIKLPLGNI